jgi:hypothetical protein
MYNYYPPFNILSIKWENPSLVVILIEYASIIVSGLIDVKVSLAA